MIDDQPQHLESAQRACARTPSSARASPISSPDCKRKASCAERRAEPRHVLCDLVAGAGRRPEGVQAGTPAWRTEPIFAWPRSRFDRAESVVEGTGNPLVSVLV